MFPAFRTYRVLEYYMAPTPRRLLPPTVLPSLHLPTPTPNCFLCGCASSPATRSTEDEIQLFKTSVRQFVNWKDSGESTTCEGCRIVIAQVSTLHQEIEAKQAKIKEIVINSVRKTNLHNNNSDLESVTTANNILRRPDRLEHDAITITTTSSSVQINSKQDDNIPLDEVEVEMEEMDCSVVVLPPPQDGDSVIPSGEEISHETLKDQNEVPEQEDLVMDESSSENDTSSSNTHFVCRKCGNLFSTRKNYVLHEVLVCKISWPTYKMHNLRIYLRSCDFPGCDEHFLHATNLERHKKESHNHEARPLENCARDAQNELNNKNAQEVTTTQNNFPNCTKCGRSVPKVLIQWHEWKCLE